MAEQPLETYLKGGRMDEIDQMVYKLYGLTKEEIAIVEEHSKSD